MTGRARTLAAAALVLGLVGLAGAAEPEPERPPEDATKALRLRARLAEEFAYRLHDPGDVAKLRTVGWAEAKYAFTEHVVLRAAVRAWYDAAFDVTDRYPANVERDEKIALSLREAVLSVSRADVDVRVGRQQIVWGEALSTFVTDVVNPRDFREFILPDFSELRIPLWALDVAYHLRPGLTLEAVWTPDTRSNTVPKQGAEFQFARIPYRFRQPVVRRPDDHDEFSLARSEGGLRLSALVEGWDTSLIYYDGADKGAVLFQERVTRPARPDVVVLEPRHPRLHVVGATVGKTFGPVVLHAEAAFTIGKRYETTDPLDRDGVVRRDTLDWLVAVDYGIASRVDTTLQVSQKILMGPATNVVRPGVEAQVTTSVALRIATGFLDDTLNPSVLAVVNANRGDVRLSARVEYLLSGAVTLAVGADVFEGGKRTLYGQFDRNDRVWMTTTWRF